MAILLLALLLLALPGSGALRAQDTADPTPPPAATDLPPTDAPPSGDDPAPTETEAPPADDGGDDPAPTETEAPPADDGGDDPAADPEIEGEGEAEVTPEATPLVLAQPPQPVPQTSCRLEISDGGDSNPYTYRFEAVGSPDIVDWSWDLGDGTLIAGTPLVNLHTYAAPGTYTITLTCTPGSGAPLTLTGTVFVTSNPIAAFDILPNAVIVGLPPFNISTLNRSSGGGALSYQWVINTVPDPLAAGIYTSTDENISYVFPTYGTYWFHLFVTDLSGTTVISSQQLSLLEPMPQARFDMTPTDGLSPLTVTFTGVDLGGGPIDTWEWDMGDGSPLRTYATGAPFDHTYTIDPLAFPSGRTFVVRLRYTGPGGWGEFAREVGVYPPTEPVDAQFSWQNQGNAGGGLVTICFTNLSSGPWVNSYWDWEDDGTYDLQTTDSIVCRDFPEGTRTVRLWVADSMGATPAAPSGATSNAAQNVSVVAAPVASFNAVPGTTITWGDLIGFVDTSSGNITDWSWDFDGDGIEDSNQQNPSGIALGQTFGGLGGNTVRLTVTGPGGSSYAEMLIVVARREITCAIGGVTEVIPTASAQSYTGIVNELLGRDVTYTWRVTGTDSVPPNTLPLIVTGGPAASVADLPLNFADFGVGTFVITLEAQTADGAACSATRTVTYNWRPLDCRVLVSPAFPSPHYPSTTNYNFSVDLANLNLDGRTINSIRWTVNGAAQGAFDDLQTFTRQWLSPASETIRYDIVVDNGDGTTASCYESVPVTVQDWPSLVCTNTSGISVTGSAGAFSPQPVTPDNPTRSYNYTAQIQGAAGRTVTYTWTITGGTIQPPGNTATVTARWDADGGEFPPALPNESIGFTALVTNPDGTTDDCSGSRSVAVTVNRLQCNAPTGDLFPVVGETELYSPTLVNHYGRPISLTWEFQVFNTVTSAWENVVPPPVFDLNANPFSYTFLIPDARYQLRYSATAAAVGDLVGDSCGPSEWLTPIQVGGSDVSFDCDAFPGAPTNNLNPASASASYPYTIDMDNGNNLPLTYTWVLVGPGLTERTLGTYTSVTADGFITFPPAPSAGFSGAAFGPVDNYTLRVDVRATNPATTPYTCSMSQPLNVGTLTVNYTYVDNGGGAVNPNAVEVGREICFTNTSFTSHGGIDAMTYNWNYGTTNNSLGVSAQAGQNPSPACFSFTQPSGPGGYTVTLTGEALDLNGNPNGRTAQRSVTFYVYGSQSIAINRSNEQFAPTTMNFQAIGVNITSAYNWLFELWNGAAWVNFANNTKTGQNVNQFFNAPGRYRATVSGSGPLGVTTAQTEFELLALTDIRAAFTPAPYGGMAPLNVCFTDRSASSSPIVSWEWDFESDGTVDATTQNPCTTYTAPGQTFTVTLRITNATGQTATATNVIRTYRDWESGASFSIAPQGAGRYCFTANITGVELVGWDFGDGTTGGPDSPICTTYAASGTYVVTMIIRNPSTGETGDIQRGLDVDLSGGPAPNLSVTDTCSADRTATFRVTNSGGAMTTPDIVTIRDTNGNVIRTESLQLAAGAFRDFILTDMDGPVSLQTLDSGLSATANCFYRPVISVSAACGAGSLPVFTVSNARPSDGPMAAPQSFTISGSGGPVLTGSFQLTLGETSETFAVPAGSDPYDTYTFSSSGAVGTFSVDETCAPRPSITASSQCVGGYPAFTITNTTANPMVVAQAFTITSSIAGDVTPAPGTFQLAAGASTTITLTGLDPYAIYTFNTTGFAGMATNVRSCGSPNLTVISACTSPIAFTVSNTGGASMLLPQAFTITDGSGADVTPAPGTFQLDADASATFTLTGLDPYAGYTFDSTGFAGTLNLTQNCARPVLDAVSACADPLAFTISNTGGDMLEPQPYTVRNASSQALLSGTFQLANGGSETITLTGISPYGGRRLETAGFAGTFNMTQTCAAPRLNVEGNCTSPAAFTVTNTGGPMLVDQPFTLTQGGGADVTPPSNTFSLASGASQIIPVPTTADMNAGVTFATARFEAAATLTMTCPSGGDDPLLPPAAKPDAAAAPAAPADSGARADGLGAGVFDLPASIWQIAGGPVCGFNCPVWRVYHSDDTGDWEIFRLDGAIDEQTQRTNLSHGEGADDMSPSRSPDARWIAFTSNRDTAEDQPDNWEIYVASTSGDPASVQRVTFNTFALDTNPAWGPNNAIVYQTTRHGNWDLYLIDMETGREFRLTDSAWDEINPAWSPDGSRVAFQSNRDGHWHIYVLDLAGRTITQLTEDGAAPVYDVDPQFSPDGSRIAFRRYDRPGSPSRLVLMDADGRNQRAITAPDMDATNQAWSPSGRLIAFQAVRGGQLDVYVYDTASGQTRQLTDSAIPDYAPTWLCGDDIVVFTSDASGSPDIYEAPALPLDAPAVDVETEAERLTFEPANDIYPQNMPPKEFASREGQTSSGVFGLQTEFLLPDSGVTPPDLTRDDGDADDWRAINACPAPGE